MNKNIQKVEEQLENLIDVFDKFGSVNRTTILNTIVNINEILKNKIILDINELKKDISFTHKTNLIEDSLIASFDINVGDFKQKITSNFEDFYTDKEILANRLIQELNDKYQEEK